jgi:hypothetical protein
MTNGLRDILLERRVGSYAAFRWYGGQYRWSGTVIQPEKTLPEQKWSDMDRQRLRAYVDTYASEKVLWDPAVRAKLQRLLGPVELDNLEDHLETRGPIRLVDSVLFVEGNIPHFASDRRGVLAINLQTGSVYAGISTEDYIRIYIRDARIPRSPSGMRRAFSLLPVIVQEWAVDMQSTCPCPKPDNVELRFGPP